MATESEYDIIVIGAGPTGLSFARSLASTGLRTAIIDRQPLDSLANPEFDGRDIALTHQSKRILTDLGVWQRIPENEISPIAAAKVLDGESPYSLNFEQTMQAKGGAFPGGTLLKRTLFSNAAEPLGYLIPNHEIRQAIFKEATLGGDLQVFADTRVIAVSSNINGAQVELASGTRLSSKLVVAADSRFSESRRMMGLSASMHDFGRICVVCRIEHDKPHDQIAREFFHYGRTLAILPLNGNQSSVVITAPMSSQSTIMGMTEQQFSADLQDRIFMVSEAQYGEIRLASERFAYPLVGVHANKFVAPRFALIGDAAVGMHPVTAHGFNLGLSGQEILANEIIKAQAVNVDIGAAGLLQRYETKHMRVTRPMYHGTNHLVRFFTDERAPAKLARRIALRLANNFPPIKHAIRHKLTESANHLSVRQLLTPTKL